MFFLIIIKMLKYDIKRWDPVILSHSIKPFPMIYINPDKEFNEYIVKNKGKVSVIIQDSDTLYDNIPITGIASQLPPVSEPPYLYMSQNNFITITLFFSWLHYPDPDKLGIVSFFDYEDPSKQPCKPLQLVKNPADPLNEHGIKCSECFESPKDDASSVVKPMNNTELCVVTLVILSIFGVLLWKTLYNEK